MRVHSQAHVEKRQPSLLEAMKHNDWAVVYGVVETLPCDEQWEPIQLETQLIPVS